MSQKMADYVAAVSTTELLAMFNSFEEQVGAHITALEATMDNISTKLDQIDARIVANEAELHQLNLIIDTLSQQSSDDGNWT